MSTEPLRPPEEALLVPKSVDQVVTFPTNPDYRQAFTATTLETFSLNGPTQKLVVDIDVSSAIGGRDSNQDAALVLVSSSEYGKVLTGLLVDGMGGHFGGEIAAFVVKSSVKTDASINPNITNPELYLQSAQEKLTVFKEAIRQAAILSMMRQAREVADSSTPIMADKPAPLVSEDDTAEDLEFGIQAEETDSETKYKLILKYIDLISISSKLNIGRLSPELIKDTIRDYDKEYPDRYVFQTIRDKIFPQIAAAGLRVTDIYTNLVNATKEMENGERILDDMLVALSLLITGSELTYEESRENINGLIELEAESPAYSHPKLKELFQQDENKNYRLVTGEMGAAATVMSIMGQYVFYASVGDCSLYAQQPVTRRLRRYTLPDTAGELIRTNPQEYLRRFANKPNVQEDLQRPEAFDNKILACIDGTGSINPRFGSLKLSPGMSLYLASDGCTITEADLTDPDAEVFEISRRLVRDKPVRPNDDNRTLVSIKVRS